MFPIGSPDSDRITIRIQKPNSDPENISVKVYTGLVGKIMQLIGFAFLANVTEDGTEVFVNKRSLAKQILINQGLEQEKITNIVKDKALEILLPNPSFSQQDKQQPLHIRGTIKAEVEFEIHKNQKDEGVYQEKLQTARLSELLSETELDLIWSNRERFPAANQREISISSKILYNYINGLTDIAGNVQNLAVAGDNLEYIAALRSIIGENTPIKVSLQTTGAEKPLSPIKSEQSKLIMPLDDFFKDSSAKSRFEKLPEKHQLYIKSSAQENYTGISPKRKDALDQEEHNLRQELPPEQQSEFRRCMDHANKQNAAPSGFIHFRLQEARKTTTCERIYIQMNKEYAEDLVRLLISELYKPGEYPGVLDIKVAGPQAAGRTDSIVIYIGDDSKRAQIDQAMREKAIKDQDRVLKKLKEIQLQRPELFGNNTMPFKNMYTPGVAIIPGLATSDSFTDNLSKAVVSALANSTTRQDLRNKIIDAYFALET